MKVSEITRPKIIELNQSGLTVELIAPPKKAYDKTTEEFLDIMIAPTLILSDKLNTNKKFDLPIDEKMFDWDIYKKFNRQTYSIGKMIRLAEIISDKLDKTISLYFSFYDRQEIINRNSDCKKIKQIDDKDLTFGKLRNILSCILKTDKDFYVINDLNDSEKRKNFTSVFKNYIDDRDYYTHGILFFLYPNFEPVLRIKQMNESKYLTYSKEIFTHNLLTYDYIITILEDIYDVLNKKLVSET